MRCGCALTMSASACNSALLHTAPEGLDGEFSTMSLVFGVMAAAMRLAGTL